MSLDVAKMSLPVSADNPAGESLEYDQMYLGLDTLATGVPANQMGDSSIEGKDPDWRQLRKDCQALWERTRDLRVACYLAVAGLAIDGLAGFVEALELVRTLTCDFWDAFWPRLDPDDDNDPMERLNILSMISPKTASFSDPLRFISLFRQTRLVPEGPKYTIRDFMLATGELEAENEKVDQQLLDAEMMSVPLDVISHQLDLVTQAVAKLDGISAMFDEKCGMTPDFASLQLELKRLKRFYEAHNIATENPDRAEEADAPADGARETAPRPAAGFADIGSVCATNRKEALLLLRKGCDYFRSSEPTSPVPLLIERALRMSEMSFIELLGEIDQESQDKGRRMFGVKEQQQ